MSLGKWFLSASLIFVSGSLLLAADDMKPAPGAPATQPVKTRKLVEPWSLMKTLTPEQTTQIEKIHADSLEQRKKIEAKEHDDIMALLTPAQLSELTMAETKHTMEMKEKSAKKKESATTEPMK